MVLSEDINRELRKTVKELTRAGGQTFEAARRGEFDIPAQIFGEKAVQQDPTLRFITPGGIAGVTRRAAASAGQRIGTVARGGSAINVERGRIIIGGQGGGKAILDARKAAPDAIGRSAALKNALTLRRIAGAVGAWYFLVGSLSFMYEEALQRFSFNLKEARDAGDAEAFEENTALMRATLEHATDPFTNPALVTPLLSNAYANVFSAYEATARAAERETLTGVSFLQEVQRARGEKAILETEKLRRELEIPQAPSFEQVPEEEIELATLRERFRRQTGLPANIPELRQQAFRGNRVAQQLLAEEEIRAERERQQTAFEELQISQAEEQRKRQLEEQERLREQELAKQQTQAQAAGIAVPGAPGQKFVQPPKPGEPLLTQEAQQFIDELERQRKRRQQGGK